MANTVTFRRGRIVDISAGPEAGAASDSRYILMVFTNSPWCALGGDPALWENRFPPVKNRATLQG